MRRGERKMKRVKIKGGRGKRGKKRRMRRRKSKGEWRDDRKGRGQEEGK